MTRRTVWLFLAAALISFSTLRAGEKGLKADMIANVEYAQKEIMSLEEAVPQEKYTWRPGEGVRSIGEVYLHIAGGNYLLTKMGGYDPPADAGWSMDDKAWESSTTDKKEIAAKLLKSFDHVKAVIAKVPEADMEKEVDFFGQKMSLRALLLVAVSHLHEHLGQSIAYARTNGVVPPWTAEQQKAEKEAKNKMTPEKKN